MRVTVVRGGGLAGLVTTTTLDEERLAPSDAATFRALVAAAAAPAAPARPPEARSRSVPPDRFAFELTVESGGTTTRLRAGEPDLSPELMELLSWVQAAPARRSSVGPPGRSS